MAKIMRRADDFGETTRRGNATFTTEQIQDICRLIKANELPDSRFSDNECSLYFTLKYELYK